MTSNGIVTRRTIVGAGVAGVSAGVLLACAGPGQSGEAPASAPGLGGREVALRVWHWDNFQIEPQTKNALDLSARVPQIKAELELVTQAEYVDKLVAQLAGGAPPDLIGFDVAGRFNVVQAKGMVRELDTLLKRDRYDLGDFYDIALRPHQWGGKRLGLPYGWIVRVWFYNQDLFRANGMKTPYEHWKAGTWTWDTCLEDAHRFRRLSDPSLFGTTALTVPSTSDSFPLLWSNNGEVFDAQYSKALLDQPAALDTFDFMHKVSLLAPAGAAAATSTPQAGKVAAWPDWSSRYFLYLTGAVGRLIEFAYGMVPPPAPPRTKRTVYIANVPGWSVIRESPHQEEAWLLLKQFVSPEGMRRTYHGGNSSPARKSLSGSREFWQSHPALPSADLMVEIAEDRATKGRILPRLSNFVDLTRVLTEEFGAAWADQQSVRDATLKTTQRLTQLLKEGEVDR